MEKRAEQFRSAPGKLTFAGREAIAGHACDGFFI